MLRRNTDLFELLTAPVTGTSEHGSSGAVPLHATNLPDVSGGGTMLLLRLTSSDHEISKQGYEKRHVYC